MGLKGTAKGGTGGKERQAPQPGKKASGATKAISAAHDIDSVKYNNAHAARHLQEADKHAKRIPPGAKSKPAVKAELRKLEAMKKKLK